MSEHQPPLGSLDAVALPFERLNLACVDGVGARPAHAGPTHVALLLEIGPAVLSVAMDREQLDRLVTMLWTCRKAMGWGGEIEPGPFFERSAGGLRRFPGSGGGP